MVFEKSNLPIQACDNDIEVLDHFKNLSLDDNVPRDQVSDPNEDSILPQATEKPEETTSSSNEDLPKDWKYVKSHPKELIIGDTSKGVTT